MDSRLSPLDLADPPEQWDSIEQRIPRQSLPPGPSTPHRIAIAAVALVVAAAGTMFAVRALTPGRNSTIPQRSAALTYTDPTGWIATYPRTWIAKPISVTADGLGTGVMFSPRQVSLGPVGAISLTIVHPLHGLEGTAPPRWSHPLPLRFEDFKTESGAGYGLSLIFREGEVRYMARVDMRAATPQQVAEIKAIIGSITFPPATDVPSTLTYNDASGWTATYPASWNVRAAPGGIDGLGGYVRFSSRTSDGHEVRVTVSPPLAANPTPADRTLLWPQDFPLSLSRFLGFPGPFEVSGRTFRHGDSFYEISAQLLGATPDNVADARLIIGSITFAG
jgi:hypothetical protein